PCAGPRLAPPIGSSRSTPYRPKPHWEAAGMLAPFRTTVFRRGFLLASATALASVLFVVAAPSAVHAAPACITPTFVNGLSQAVFPSGTANYINEQGWVEAPFDSDSDGKPDRIHFDVSRPLETGHESNLTVPVIVDDRPYYTGR